MTTLEITLIIIGVVFLIGSFMVNDKLSHKDLDKIADMSAEELKIITEKLLLLFSKVYAILQSY